MSSFRIFYDRVIHDTVKSSNKRQVVDSDGGFLLEYSSIRGETRELTFALPTVEFPPTARGVAFIPPRGTIISSKEVAPPVGQSSTGLSHPRVRDISIGRAPRGRSTATHPDHPCSREQRPRITSHRSRVHPVHLVVDVVLVIKNLRFDFIIVITIGSFFLNVLGRRGNVHWNMDTKRAE